MNWAFATVVPLVSLMLIVGVGCDSQNSQSTPQSATSSSTPTLEQAIDTFESYGKLPRLRDSNHAELLDELKRIESERGTPELIQTTPLPDEENIATALIDLFPADRLEQILRRSKALFPQGKFIFEPNELQRAIAFRQGHESYRKKIATALTRPKCDFQLRHVAGYTADLSWIDVVRIGGHLEAFLAAEQFQLGKPSCAIESWERMMQLAACLADEKRVSARLEAAFLRADALHVLATLVNAPETTYEDLKRLALRMRLELRHWTDDDQAWIGDRALGLHLYEVARDGRLLDVLSDEERQQLDEEGFLKDLPNRLHRTIDQDELYYLTAMRKIIARCKRPYFQRVALFDEIGQELESRLRSQGNSYDFPLIAGRLLFADVRKGHEIQARDRARCEAWALALSTAVGEKWTHQTNPLSGQPYRVRELDDRVVVSHIGSEEPGEVPSVVVVPRPEKQDTEPHSEKLER